jgi:PAS domain S-box-containing protein
VSPSAPDSRLLIESITDYAIFMLDPEGRVTSWNQGARIIKGYEASEIIGRHFSAFYPPSDIEAKKPERELELAAKHGRIEDRGWRLRKDGSRFWANVVITALRDPEGRLVGFAKVSRDLTEEWTAAEALRVSEQRFRLLVDSVTDYAIYMLDPTGHVATWNAGATRVKGYAASEIIGKHFSVFFPPEDVAAGKPPRELEIAREHGRFEEESFRVRCDGTLFWANVIITPVRDTRGELVGFAKVTRDLSARRQTEEVERALFREQSARSAAENANQMKDEFLATVSHEIRTPLNAILGWAFILRDPEMSASIPKGMDSIQRNAQSQAKIIDDILDVSRIITGKLKIEVKPTNLVDIVAESIDVVRPSAVAKKIEIEWASRSAPVVLLIDPDRIRQVIWNLLSNAVKFTGSGGVVSVSVEEEASAVTVAVTDTGRGIDPSFLPFVFDRFRQADGSTTRAIGGLGLGLAIVRHIVELHGGTVVAESAGAGATFRVSLPLGAATGSQPALRADKLASATVHRNLEGVRVMVVDDDADARDLLHDVITSAGATVTVAKSAEEAFDLVLRSRPQVLVSDVAMPGEDGYSLARRIRALAPEAGGRIPALALTARTRAEDRKRAEDAGFSAHLGKPVVPSELIAAIAGLIAPPKT